MLMSESLTRSKPSRLGLFADNPRFRFLSISLIVSTFGDQVAGVGYVFVAFGLSGSAGAVSGVVIAQVVPYLIFGLLGGALSSIIARRQLMLFVDAMRVILQGLLGVLALTSALSMPVLLMGVFLVSVGGSLFNPFARTSMVEYVPEDRLVTANSILAIGQNLSTVLAPVLAAVLASISIGLFFFVDAATYLLGMLFLFRLLLLDRREHQDAGGVGKAEQRIVWKTLPQEVRSALKRFYQLTRTAPVLLTLFATTFATVIFNTWSWEVGLFLRLVPGGQGERINYSIALSIFAAVCVSVNVVILKLVKSLSMTHYLLGVVVWGVGMLGVAALPAPVGVWLGIVVLASGLTFASQARVFIIQTSVPLKDVGQAFSLAAILLYLANTLGVAIFTPLEPLTSPAVLMGVSGGGLLLCAVGGYLAVVTQGGQDDALK